MLYNHHVFTAILFSLRQKKIKHSLYALVGAVVVYMMVYGALWHPAMTEYQKINDEIAQTKRLVITQMAHNKMAERYPTLLASTQNTFEKINTPTLQSAFNEKMSQLVNKHRIHVLNETNVAGVSKKGFTPLLQEMTLQGEYTEIKAFLTELDTLPYWTEIQNINISRISVSSQEVNATVLIKIY